MIDIIVPIYSGLEEIKECLQSLINNTNELNHRFILINDNPSNKEVAKLLSKFDDKRIIVLTNEENLGFIKTINKGIQASKNDVILLNSDTIVTNNWTDKMYEAAYSDNKIATVTPLTNSGSIASTPIFNKPNKLVDGFTVKEFGKLVENISKKIYPVIPTAVGFAMYIKRSIIDEIGYLDEIYGKGYCEEEDFSCRVIKHGYKNVLADNVFIYHKGNVSFQNEKKELILKNKRILKKRYWWHAFAVKKFLYFNKEVKEICLHIEQEIKHLEKLPHDVQKEMVL